jgi:hypothetical protein
MQSSAVNASRFSHLKRSSAFSIQTIKLAIGSATARVLDTATQDTGQMCPQFCSFLWATQGLAHLTSKMVLKKHGLGDILPQQIDSMDESRIEQL